MMPPGAVLLLGLLDAGATTEPSPPPPPPSPSVYEVHLAVDIPVTVAAASMGLVRILWEDDIARIRCPCDPAGLNAIDRGTVGNHSHAASLAGDITVYTVMAALPLADLVDLGFGRTWGEDFMVYAETLAVDTAIQNAVNFAVSRPRPRTYAGDPAFLKSGEGYLSFYAGHVATAFSALSAASVTIGRRYGQRVWPWILTAVLAGSVAFERVASGHHFPSDVAVAAVVGTAEGITIPWLHARKRTLPVTIAPSPTSPGLVLVGVF